MNLYWTAYHYSGESPPPVDVDVYTLPQKGAYVTDTVYTYMYMDTLNWDFLIPKGNIIQLAIVGESWAMVCTCTYNGNYASLCILEMVYTLKSLLLVGTSSFNLANLATGSKITKITWG